MGEKQDVNVLITRDFPENAAELLESEGFSVTTWHEERPMNEGELIEKAKKHNALLCTITEKIDKQFLSACSHLDVISQYAVGYDNIDIPEATKLGIPIGYTPDAMSEATADIAFGLMIATSRKMIHLHKTILNNEWHFFRPRANLGIELKNKTLGILGLGRIGIKMAERCRGAYQMNVIYHNRTARPEAEKALNARMVDFNTLLEQSDVLSVHVSLHEDLIGLFDKSAFSRMKKTAIFINTSRGLIHNETDLIDALESGQIWGAGLDVTNPEPMQPDNPLLSMENVTVLPHIGSATREAREEMSRLAAVNIIEFYKSKRVPHVVNPEALKEKSKKG